MNVLVVILIAMGAALFMGVYFFVLCVIYGIYKDMKNRGIW